MPLVQPVLENARCARHVDAAAVLLCARCGDYACSACVRADTGLCVACKPPPRIRVDPTKRLLAASIDGAFATAPVLFIVTAPALAPADSDLIRYGLVALGVLSVLIYLAAQWRGVARSGQSIGKRVMRLRVVRAEDGGPVSVWTVLLLRNVLPTAIGAIPFLGGLFALVNLGFGLRADGRCLHDHIASTVVVHDRPGVPRGQRERA